MNHAGKSLCTSLSRETPETINSFCVLLWYSLSGWKLYRSVLLSDMSNSGLVWVYETRSLSLSTDVSMLTFTSYLRNSYNTQCVTLGKRESPLIATEPPHEIIFMDMNWSRGRNCFWFVAEVDKIQLQKDQCSAAGSENEEVLWTQDGLV